VHYPCYSCRICCCGSRLIKIDWCVCCCWCDCCGYWSYWLLFDLRLLLLLLLECLRWWWRRWKTIIWQFNLCCLLLLELIFLQFTWPEREHILDDCFEIDSMWGGVWIRLHCDSEGASILLKSYPHIWFFLLLLQLVVPPYKNTLTWHTKEKERGVSINIDSSCSPPERRWGRYFIADSSLYSICFLYHSL